MRAKIAILFAAAALAGCAGGGAAGPAPTVEAALASLPLDALPAYVEVTAHSTVFALGGLVQESDLLIRRDSAGYEYEEESRRTKDGAPQTQTNLHKPADGTSSELPKLDFLKACFDRSMYGAPEEYLPPVREGELWRFSPKDSSMKIEVSFDENGNATNNSRMPKPTIYYSPKSGRVEKVVAQMDIIIAKFAITTEFVWNSASSWPTSLSQRVGALRSDGDSKPMADVRYERIQVKAVEPFSAESLFRERAP